MGEAMVVIQEYTSEAEAHVARSVLEAHDIPAVVLRDNAGGMLPSMHIIFPVRLAVREDDAPRAVALLDAQFTDHDIDDPDDDDPDIDDPDDDLPSEAH
jgi:hypothetical protein